MTHGALWFIGSSHTIVHLHQKVPVKSNYDRILESSCVLQSQVPSGKRLVDPITSTDKSECQQIEQSTYLESPFLIIDLSLKESDGKGHKSSFPNLSLTTQV